MDYDPKSVVAFLERQATQWTSGDAVALSIRYALSLDWVDALVLGADSPAQIQGLAKIASYGALPSEAVAHIQSTRPDVPGLLLDPSRWL